MIIWIAIHGDMQQLVTARRGKMMHLEETSYPVRMSVASTYLIDLANRHRDQEIQPGISLQHKTIQGKADNYSRLSGNKKVVQRQKPIMTPTSPA